MTYHGVGATFSGSASLNISGGGATASASGSGSGSAGANYDYVWDADCAAHGGVAQLMVEGPGAWKYVCKDGYACSKREGAASSCGGANTGKPPPPPPPAPPPAPPQPPACVQEASASNDMPVGLSAAYAASYPLSNSTLRRKLCNAVGNPIAEQCNQSAQPSVCYYAKVAQRRYSDGTIPAFMGRNSTPQDWEKWRAWQPGKTSPALTSKVAINKSVWSLFAPAPVSEGTPEASHVSLPPPPPEEEGLSTAAKVAIGVGAVALVGAIAYFATRDR